LSLPEVMGWINIRWLLKVFYLMKIVAFYLLFLSKTRVLRAPQFLFYFLNVFVTYEVMVPVCSGPIEGFLQTFIAFVRAFFAAYLM
jgi:hypothetical protein